MLDYYFNLIIFQSNQNILLNSAFCSYHQFCSIYAFFSAVLSTRLTSIHDSMHDLLIRSVQDYITHQSLYYQKNNIYYTLKIIYN